MLHGLGQKMQKSLMDTGIRPLFQLDTTRTFSNGCYYIILNRYKTEGNKKTTCGHFIKTGGLLYEFWKIL